VGVDEVHPLRAEPSQEGGGAFRELRLTDVQGHEDIRLRVRVGFPATQPVQATPTVNERLRGSRLPHRRGTAGRRRHVDVMGRNHQNDVYQPRRQEEP
jgi:hypothetical protein